MYMFHGQIGYNNVNADDIRRIELRIKRHERGRHDSTLVLVELHRSRSFARDEPLELFVAVEERVELGEGRQGWAGEVVWFVVVINRVGEGVVEDVKRVVCMWVRLGRWTGVGV
jgi:hypothetical protein